MAEHAFKLKVEQQQTQQQPQAALRGSHGVGFVANAATASHAKTPSGNKKQSAHPQRQAKRAARKASSQVCGVREGAGTQPITVL
jgi:hypothetical protein